MARTERCARQAGLKTAGAIARWGSEMTKTWLPLVALLAWFAAAYGDEAPAPRAWNSLTQEQRQALKPFEQHWTELPPERQQRLLQGAQRWQQMTPEERAHARERFEHWKQMSPEERDQVRRRFERFRNLPPEEQERLRHRHQWFKNLPPERRQELRQRWQQMTPEERARFRDKLHQRREKSAPEPPHDRPMHERGQH